MEKNMSLKHCTGSCHCGAVRYEATIDLAKGTVRCNCSICKKARAWFTFAGGKNFPLLEGEEALTSYQWTPSGRPGPRLPYLFCKTRGIRIYATRYAHCLGRTLYLLAFSPFHPS